MGLTPAEIGVWFGMIEGHVVALFGKDLLQGHGGVHKIEGALHHVYTTPALSVQVSHPDPLRIISESELQCGPRIRALIESGSARIAIDSHRSLLFLFDARFIESGDVLRSVVHEFLAGLNAAGIQIRGKRCHWCGQRDAADCTFIEGRATHICDHCREDRSGRAKSSRPLSAAGIGAVLLVGALAAIPGAIIAASLQILYFSLMEWITGGNDATLHVPRLLLMLFLGGYAIAVAAPIAFIINRVRERGDRFAALVAFVSTLFASVFAEVLVVAWITGNLTEWLNPWFVKQVLALTWKHADFGVAARVVLAVIAGIVTSIWVRPHVRPFFE